MFDARVYAFLARERAWPPRDALTRGNGVTIDLAIEFVKAPGRTPEDVARRLDGRYGRTVRAGGEV
jgi:hypothetical protein